MQFKDYYKILGVTENATQDEIRKSYRRLARKYHPDVSKAANAEERFKEVGEAYEALRDKDKRAAYDNLRKGGWQGGEEFRPPPDWDSSGFRFHRQQGGDAGGFSDFFESLFGGLGATQRRPGRPGGFRAPPQRGQDLRARLELDLESAFSGATRRISLDTPHGARTVDVKIPAGVRDGQTIRLRGQGGAGAGGQRGDLLLEVDVLTHPLFKLDGRNLTLELPVAPWEAALGATVSVPTLNGAVNLKVPPASQSGRKLRLRGRGMPGKTPGDLFVALKLVTPEADSEDDKAFYQRMAENFDFNPREHL